VRLKWPNDLYVSGAKLAGILVEARWRDAQLEWAAIGLGVNLIPPAGLAGAALRPNTSRVHVLSEIVPAIRAAAAATGPLTARELAEYASRDLALGRRCREPVAGTVAGIDADGSLLVHAAEGTVSCRSGSLVLEEE